MPILTMKRSLALTWLFVKEQLKEPVSLFWMIISPAATYYLLVYYRGGFSHSTSRYLENTSWFYAYVSSSVAFFGFSFYIIGRRESGFIRSFIYTMDAKLVFMLAQYLAYSLIALIYCAVFFGLTYFSFGPFEVFEFLHILGRFYVCYMLFSVFGILLSLLPLSFQNANTVFSVTSFVMLVLGVLSIRSESSVIDLVNVLNPLCLANSIMVGGVENNYFIVSGIFVLFIAIFLLSLRFLRINPVWSRY